MKNHNVVAVIAVMASASILNAGGLDRSGQPTGAIFSEDGSVNFSAGVVSPRVTGSDTGSGVGRYDVGDTYSQFSLSYTNRISDSLTYSILFDQPYGANITYSGDPLTDNLAGVGADISSQAVTFIMRHQFDQRISVFGGLSYQGIEGQVSLNGRSYRNAFSLSAVTAAFNDALPSGSPTLSATVLGGALAGNTAAQTLIDTTYGAGTVTALGTNVTSQATTFAATGGYTFEMDEDYALGYLIGASYEIPEIALRLAVTYREEVDHAASTTENIFGTTVRGQVQFVTPRSLNVDFQTGIAADTLLNASMRWTDYSAVDIVPTALGSDLVSLDDSYRYTLGLARRINDQFAGSFVISFEPTGNAATVSPLGPTDGQLGISLGGRYTNGNISISGGVNYTRLGDAFAGVAEQPVASFSDNDVIGIGLRTDFSF